jgi:restriction endonuclease Mrr
MTDLTKSGLIEKVQPKTHRATPRGIAFLKEHPDAITVRDLKTLPAFSAWLEHRAEHQDKCCT